MDRQDILLIIFVTRLKCVSICPFCLELVRIIEESNGHTPVDWYVQVRPVCPLAI